MITWYWLIHAKVRHKFWSARNWARGYQFGPVRRWRCCGHTTPFHNAECVNHPLAKAGWQHLGYTEQGGDIYMKPQPKLNQPSRFILDDPARRDRG